VIAPALDAADIAAHAAYAERRAIVSVEDPVLGPIRMPAAVPRLLDCPGEVRWAGPDPGAHNDEVYRGLLGMTPAELAELKRLRVV
jgi:crotonobetainyl-CoA:carnitine CoA-transferase CaiB-like acyl-CoA transferase